MMTWGAWILLSAPCVAAPGQEMPAPFRVIRVHVDTPRRIPLDALTVPPHDQDPGPWPPRLATGTFTVVAAPSHGRLVGSPPALTYVPNAGYRGADRLVYRIGGGESRSLRLRVEPFSPPLGVPAPLFGIAERHLDVGREGRTYDFGDGPEPYPSGPNGPFTHYVDMTHPDATDEGNPFGTPDRPRRTIPESVSAGSVVEIHGGPYTGGRKGRLKLVGAGTRTRPVFFRGAGPENRPILRGVRLTLDGSHLVMEHFDLVASHVRIRGSAVVLRHAEVRHWVRDNALSLEGREGVVYNCLVHHIGDQETPNDRHGLHAAGGSERSWFLDNHVHRCSGDGIQFAHGAVENPPRFVYVGRNFFHENAENAIDVKYAEDVVLSENVAWGYRPIKRGRVGSDGTAIILGSDGGPRRIWVLGNVVTRAVNAVRNEETTEAWIVGNLFFGLERAGVALEKKASDLHIAANTFHDMDVGVDLYKPGDFRLRVEGNIFSAILGRRRRGQLRVDDPDVAARSILKGNLFWQGDDPLLLRWGKGRFSLAPDAEIPIGSGNRRGNPRYLDAASGDFRPGPEGVAIDGGFPPEAIRIFRRMYGFDLAGDLRGTPRPRGKAWDLGAFEGEPPPAPSTDPK